MLSEPILVIARIVQAFDSLGVTYVVGGSLASSIYGIPCATPGLDLVADLQATDADKLTRLLSGDFYVDADMIRGAVLKRSSFNVIHLETMFKADVFVMKRDAWSREEMARARQERRRGKSVLLRLVRAGNPRRRLTPTPTIAAACNSVTAQLGVER
jgi:hypothetical protein